MYPGLIDYRPNNPIEGVDARRHGIRTEFDAIEANVLNIIPPQKAGAVAAMAGAVNVDGRWCEGEVSLESTSRIAGRNFAISLEPV